MTKVEEKDEMGREICQNCHMSFFFSWRNLNNISGVKSMREQGKIHFYSFMYMYVKGWSLKVMRKFWRLKECLLYITFFSVCNSLYDLFSDKSKTLKYDGIKSIIGGENGGGGI